jgi:hypothetical protein
MDAIRRSAQGKGLIHIEELQEREHLYEICEARYVRFVWCILATRTHCGWVAFARVIWRRISLVPASVRRVSKMSEVVASDGSPGSGEYPR